MALQIQALTFWLGSLMMSHVCTSYLSSHKPLWIKTTEVQYSFTRISAPCQILNLRQYNYISFTSLYQHICSPSQPHKKEICLKFYSSPLVSSNGHSCSARIYWIYETWQKRVLRTQRMSQKSIKYANNSVSL